MHEYTESFEHIKTLLQQHPKGLTITDISKHLTINRNSVAKYLDVLLTSGNIEMRTIGPAKVYTYSKRISLSQFIHHSEDFIIVVDENKSIIQANKSFLTFMDIQGDTALNRPITSLHASLFTPDILSHVDNALQGKTHQTDMAFASESTTYFFQIRFVPTVLTDNKPGALILLQDITQQKYNENALLHLMTIMNALPEAITSHQLDGIILQWNKPAERLYGYTQQEAVGKHHSLIIPPEHLQEITAIEDTIKKKKLIPSHQTTRTTKAGKKIVVMATIIPIVTKDKVIGYSTISRQL